MTQNQAQNQDILSILSRIETRLSNVEKKLGIQNTFEKLEQKNPSEVQDFYFSSIVKKDDIPLILSWMPKKVKNFELLYDSIKDGSNAGAFHKKCDAKKPTITFVKTKKNRRFGGYTEKTWNESNGNYIVDENAFLFSIDEKEKYIVSQPKYSIYNNAIYGPTFGGAHDLYISNFCTQNNESYSSGRDYKLKSKYALNGENNFIVESYEVYHVIYE